MGDGVKVFANRFNQKEAHMNYSGIDLHSNNSVITVIDEADHVVAEKRLPCAAAPATYWPLRTSRPVTTVPGSPALKSHG